MLWVGDIKQTADLLLCRLCCRSSQSKYTTGGAQLFPDHFVQHKVSWAEVVRPFRGAMDLIYTDHGDTTTILAQILSEEAFWCDEKNFDLLVLNRCHDGLLYREALLRVDTGAGHVIWQLSKLICHEGNQRCDHEDEARHKLASVLIDKGLAATGCKDYESIFPFLCQNFDSFELALEEVVVTEAFLQNSKVTFIRFRNSVCSFI